MYGKIIFLVLDNIRIGGIQRLCLDEAYSLSRRGFQVRIYLIEGVNRFDDLRELDWDYARQFCHSIVFLENFRSEFSFIRILLRDLRRFQPISLVSHSAKGMMLSKVAKLMTFRSNRTKIIGFIHQLVTLSDRKQRIKRLIMFCFAEDLRVSSLQFKLELEKWTRQNPMLRILFRKKICFDRMGVDLKRIQYYFKQSKNPKEKSATLVFLSRIVGWKGFSTFLKICQDTDLGKQKIVFVPQLFSQTTEIKNFLRIANSQIMANKGIYNLPPEANAVHIYPSYYGEAVSFPQSIGMNVLECLAVGIPSLISFENFESWPELRNSCLVETTRWDDVTSHKKIAQLLSINNIDRKREVERLYPVISIENHINLITQLAATYNQ